MCMCPTLVMDHVIHSYVVYHTSAVPMGDREGQGLIVQLYCANANYTILHQSCQGSRNARSETSKLCHAGMGERGCVLLFKQQYS